MMLRKLGIGTAILLFSATLFAQETVLSQNVEADTVEQTWGKNRKHYDYAFMALGLVVGEPDDPGAEIRMGTSYEFQLGWRHKFRVGNFYSFGTGLSLVNRVYNLKQDSGKVFPNDILHDSERLSMWTINGQVFNRFNFGRRGNIVGNYLDLGVYGEFAFDNRVYIRNQLSGNNAANARQERVTYSRLRYIDRLDYGVDARIGMGHLVLFGRYRLSDLFKRSYNYPELTRITAGIEIGLY